MRIFIVLILLIFFLRCNLKTKDIYDHPVIPANKCLASDNIQLPFHTDSVHRIKYFHNKNSSDDYLFLKSSGNNIYFLNLHSKKLTLIPFPTKIDIIDFAVHSIDSIYLLTEDIIYLIDNKGHLTNTIEIPSIKGYYFFASSLFPFYIIDSLAFFYKYPEGIINSLDKYHEFINSDREVCYDIKHQQFIDLKNKIHYPKELKYHFKYVFNPYRIIDDKMNLIYSFEHSDTVTLLNYTSQNIQTFSIKSKFFENNNDFDFEKINNFSEIAKYLIQNSRYHSILYDPYRELYYRIHLCKYTYYNKDNSINLRTDVPWSILVCNKEFKVIKEILFEPRTYYFNHIIITKDGLLIKKQSYANTYSLFNAFTTL